MSAKLTSLFRRLPNFLPNVPVVAVCIWTTGWVQPDYVTLAISSVMFVGLIGCAYCDLMVLHPRAKGGAA